ncbi:MAG: ABC transporter permease [Flavobacteriaceae bacterium]|nr:ABC transporter permease [Flavobacteriaceae bacterium]
MNVALFFARKMQGQKQNKSTVSERIINIATVAVAIGIAAILIAIATSEGLQREIQKKTSVFNGHILVTPFENNESQVSLLPFEDTPALRSQIKEEKNVDRIHSIVLKAGMLKTKNDFEGFLLKGVSDDFDWSSLSSFLTQGTFPKLEKESVTNEILISETMADRLGIRLGQKVDAYFQNESGEGLPNRRRFTVVGIYFSGFPDIDQNLIYGDLRQVQRLNRWSSNQIGGYELFVNDFQDLDPTANRIYERLPSELNCSSISERFSGIFQWIALFDFNVLIILIVMLLVGIINMATALLVLILERSRMIGLLKALGADNTLVQKIFLYNGTVIMSKGLFWGNLIGLGFYFSQQYWGWIQLDPETYFVNQAPVYISWFQVFFINLFFLGISSLFLWIPSKIILRISPSRVLRYR